MSDAPLPAGWLRDAAGTGYPPEPWYLRGRLVASLWRARLEDLPALDPALGDPVGAFGRTLVGTIFAVYEPPGVLAYSELLVAVRVRRGLRTYTHVPLIWVDSPASMAGARAMWGIPKRLAAFEVHDEAGLLRARIYEEGSPLASLRFTPGAALPGHWPLSTKILHRCGGTWARSDGTARGRLQHGNAQWEFARGGPLRFLRGRRPLVSVRVTQMTLTFGSRS